MLLSMSLHNLLSIAPKKLGVNRYFSQKKPPMAGGVVRSNGPGNGSSLLFESDSPQIDIEDLGN